jgi:hypothetical protein
MDGVEVTMVIKHDLLNNDCGVRYNFTRKHDV